MSDLFDWVEKDFFWEDGTLKSRSVFNGELKNGYQLIFSKTTYIFVF